jgi:hypothetical protein
MPDDDPFDMQDWPDETLAEDYQTARRLAREAEAERGRKGEGRAAHALARFKARLKLRGLTPEQHERVRRVVELGEREGRDEASDRRDEPSDGRDEPSVFGHHGDD